MEFSGKNTGVCCCFPPGDLPDTGMGLVSPVSLHWQANTLLLSHLGKHYGRYFILISNCWFLYIGIKYWNIYFYIFQFLIFICWLVFCKYVQLTYMHNGVFCRFFWIFSVYYNLLCIFNVFYEWRVWLLPFQLYFIFFFLALLHLQELTIQCCIEIERMGLFALSFILRGKIQSLIIKCSVSWSLPCYFWCFLLDWGSFLLLLLYWKS